MSEEATDELLGGEGRGLEIAATVIAVVEADGAVVGELIEAAVGDGDTEEVQPNPRLERTGARPARHGRVAVGAGRSTAGG